MTPLAIQLDTGARGLLPAQASIIHEQDAWIRVILGGLGSGKTRGAALCFLLHCLRNSWHAGYGYDQPISMVLSTTVSVMRDSAARELRALCPPALILHETKQPWEWTLINGHKIVFKAVRSATGGTMSGVWLDEAHLLKSKDAYVDIQARVRDPRGQSRLLLVSGVPERGWLSDVFEDSAGDPERCVVFASTVDNHYLPDSVVAQIRRSVSVEEAAKFIDGRWIKPRGVVFYAYDPARNLTNQRGDPSQTTHIGFDSGVKSAVIFGQVSKVSCKDVRGVEYIDQGIHVVDQLVPVGKSTREIFRSVKERRWALTPDSVIAIDPKVGADVLTAIREEVPQCRIVRRSRKAHADSVEVGYRCVNAGFQDADGNHRVTIYRGIGGVDAGADGLLTALPKLRRAPSGLVYAQDVLDHSTDALRYLVQHFLPAISYAAAAE